MYDMVDRIPAGFLFHLRILSDQHLRRWVALRRWWMRVRVFRHGTKGVLGEESSRFFSPKGLWLYYGEDDVLGAMGR